MTATDTTTPIIADHPIGADGSLSVRLAAADLRVRATDGDRVIVRSGNGDGRPSRVVFEPGSGTLTIREKERFGITFGRGGTVRIEIDVPSRAEVSLEIASGRIDASGLRGPQRYRSVSGDVRLADCAGRIDASAVSGEIELNLAGPTELSVKSVSGDIAVGGGPLEALRLSTTSGDARIDSPLVGRFANAIETLSGDVDLAIDGGLRVEARTVSGDLSSDLPHRSDGRMGRRALVIGDGAVELAFRSVSGDLRIRHALPAESAVRRDAGERAVEPPEAAGSDPDATGAERLAILRALEQGDLDVGEAMARLAELDERSDV